MNNNERLKNLTPEYLSQLLTSDVDSKLDHGYGPVNFLAQIVRDVAASEGLTHAQSLSFIAAKGRDWNGGREGRIAVRVRDWGDELWVQWVDEAGTWCTMDDLLDAVQDENRTPVWYDDDCVEVHDGDGRWVQRNVLESRSAKWAE